MPAHGLEIEEDLEFQRREWAFQRVGVWAIAAFVVAAALGLFGAGGTFSRARARAPEGAFWVDYDRFARVGAAARLQVHWPEGSANAPEPVLTLNRAYFDTIRVEQIIPEPKEIVLDSERVRLRFAAESIEPGGAVILDYQPDDVGSQQIQIQVDELAPVSFTQFAYF
jgi:hypothetical protein